MKHSLKTISEFICDHYGISIDQLISGDRHWKILKPYHIIIQLAGPGRDDEIARCLGRDRTTICNNRKSFWANMQVDSNLQAEFNDLKLKLIKYEIT